MIAEKVIEQAAWNQKKRIDMINTAWKAYYGDLDKPLKVVKGQPDDNIRLNYSALVVDYGVSFLFDEKLTFEAESSESESDGEEQVENPADVWLQKCLKKNKAPTLLHNVGLNGGVCGHTFIKIVDRKPYPRLVVLDPLNVTPIWGIEDFDDIISFVIQWSAVDSTTMQSVARRQTIERNGELDAKDTTWIITDYISRGNNTAWEQMRAPATWPYPWPPIAHCQNLPRTNEFWGKSDLESDVVDVNNAVNLITSNISRILKYHAHPKTWGAGFQANKMDVSIDGIIGLPQGGSLHNLEMQSDLGSSLEFFRELKQAWHEITQIPAVATGKLESIGALSGIALDILFRPILQRTNVKQLLYGDMLSELMSHLLELGGLGSDCCVEIHWPNVLPVNPQEDAQTGLLLDQLGVSKDTILTKLGFDPVLEAEKKAEETKDAAELGSTILEQFDQGKGAAGTPPPSKGGAKPDNAD